MIAKDIINEALIFIWSINLNKMSIKSFIEFLKTEDYHEGNKLLSYLEKGEKFAIALVKSNAWFDKYEKYCYIFVEKKYETALRDAFFKADMGWNNGASTAIGRCALLNIIKKIPTRFLLKNYSENAGNILYGACLSDSVSTVKALHEKIGKVRFLELYPLERACSNSALGVYIYVRKLPGIIASSLNFCYPRRYLEYGQTPYNIELLKKLLSDDQIDTTQLSSYSTHIVLSRKNVTKLLDFLISGNYFKLNEVMFTRNDHSKNYPSGYQFTGPILFLAVHLGNLEVVKYILSRKDYDFSFRIRRIENGVYISSCQEDVLEFALKEYGEHHTMRAKLWKIIELLRADKRVPKTVSSDKLYNKYKN